MRGLATADWDAGPQRPSMLGRSNCLVSWLADTNLKPSTQSISLRLPVHTLERIKAAANARDVPYQSLIKVWLEEKLLA